ncbi:NAD(P)H-dependent flavin oxidoreductase [Kitasatospora sp. NPDC057692]|uniref:NAD(P)H-dependent flavin oxidoreductase n=1 Tax=Kitasatospora sp. NPDC057692 TaxID=3346215 RepID=UPI00367A2CB1
MSVGRVSTRTRITELLGIDHPIVQGPFGGGYSTVRLAAAVSNGGGLGSYGAHVLAPSDIAATVAEIKARTARPFAVNLWIPQPGEREPTMTESEFATHIGRLRPYLDRLGLPDPQFPASFGEDFDQQVDALLEARPPVFSFVMGIPPGDVLAEARRRGIVTLGTATTVDEAVALDEAGVDAVVASGADAGGHRGAFLRPTGESLVGTFSLVPQVVDAVSVPVVAAGGIADGRGIAAALVLGADAVQIGTGFLATDESGASAVHKRALHSPQARVTVLTSTVSGRQARTIANRFVREMAGYEGDLPPYPVQGALTEPIRRAAVERGLPDYLNLWAGQAAPLTRPRTAQEYLAALVEAIRPRV